MGSFNYLVTGAGRDIGQAIAVALARSGSFGILHHSDSQEGAKQTLKSVRDKGGDGVVMQADFRCSREVALFGSVVRQTLDGRKLTALVHNSAFTSASVAGELDSSALTDVLSVNVLAPYLITDSLSTELADAGSIVAISIAATNKVFSPDFGFFAASKAALETMVKNWAAQFGSRQIRANAVAPGVIDVNFRSNLLKDEDFRRSLESGTALGRPGTPDDVADLVKFLTSPESRWITGQTIEASGGWKL